MKRAAPYLAALAGIAIGVAIGWTLAGADVGQLGDWRGGAGRFIGMLGAIGGLVGYVGARVILGKRPAQRDGFTLSFRRIDPQATGYREVTTLTVGDLVAALAAVGYEPHAEACDDAGLPVGAIDPTTPLAGANLALRDRGVRGWVRVQLAPPDPARARSLGLVEIWSERGDSAEELGLYVVRVLDELVGDVHAARESSRLGEDSAKLLTAGLGPRPVHRA